MYFFQADVLFSKGNAKGTALNQKYASQNIKYANQKTKYADQNTKCAILIEKHQVPRLKHQVIYAVLSRGNFCREFTHFFGVQFSNALAYKKWQISSMLMSLLQAGVQFNK